MTCASADRRARVLSVYFDVPADPGEWCLLATDKQAVDALLIHERRRHLRRR